MCTTFILILNSISQIGCWAERDLWPKHNYLLYTIEVCECVLFLRSIDFKWKRNRRKMRNVCTRIPIFFIRSLAHSLTHSLSFCHRNDCGCLSFFIFHIFSCNKKKTRGGVKLLLLCRRLFVMVCVAYFSFSTIFPVLTLRIVFRELLSTFTKKKRKTWTMDNNTFIMAMTAVVVFVFLLQPEPPRSLTNNLFGCAILFFFSFR